jgi:hypothetical protein
VKEDKILFSSKISLDWGTEEVKAAQALGISSLKSFGFAAFA